MRTSSRVFLLFQSVVWLLGARAVQILSDLNVEIVARTERRANIARRLDDALQARNFPRWRGLLQRQAEVDDDKGCARTISVSIHIISMEFHGGGS